MGSQIYLYAFCTAVLLQFCQLVYTAFLSPVRSIPGPFWAKFSRLWYFKHVSTGTFHDKNIELHKKYGPVVRLAPNWFSIEGPQVVKEVYGPGSKFPKSDWYQGWKHPSPDRWTLFPDQNVKRHNETRRVFQSMYSINSLVHYEGYVDNCARIFDDRLEEFARQEKIIDMAHWFQCYAFDVIGEITYSKRFGFLDEGKDIHGILAKLHQSMIYSTLAGIYSKLHPVLYHIVSRFDWSGAAGRNAIMRFVQDRVDQRKKEREGIVNAQTPKDKDPTAPEDFLDKLMDANLDDPVKVTPYHIFMMGLSNIIAGSDTTAVSLSSVLYYLLKFPNTMQKLQREVDSAQREGRCAPERITYRESEQLPYLQAVIKEALRMHSATGLPLWRVVHDGGAEILGQYFPAGNIVGINTWCAHYNADVFENPTEFRPERWLDAGEEKLKEMNHYWMPFGMGSRICLGRHISMLEMSKLIPRLVRDFDFELATPEKKWHTINYWFVKPTDFHVKVKPRKK